ncbi:MAG: hypothetical protein QOK29_5247, partial [Rhodospirillaceae bacterium]|nr:hypothetical protein [Rhodospirillaceae bacterium]
RSGARSTTRFRGDNDLLLGARGDDTAAACELVTGPP